MKADRTTNRPLAGLDVLVVEDRYLIASDIAEEVRRLGGAVVGPAPSISAASALIERQPVDLAVLDINLDGEMAFPLAARLSERGTAFLFVTGYDEWVLPSEWRDRPRLRKPFKPGALGRELARLI